jgi:hypothetical protein
MGSENRHRKMTTEVRQKPTDKIEAGGRVAREEHTGPNHSGGNENQALRRQQRPKRKTDS